MKGGKGEEGGKEGEQGGAGEVEGIKGGNLAPWSFLIIGAYGCQYETSSAKMRRGSGRHDRHAM